MEEQFNPKETGHTEINTNDASEISIIALNHFARIEVMLPFQHFRVHSIKPNAEPDFWVVICSFDEKFGSNNRLRFELHVNKLGIVKEQMELT